MGKKTAAVFAAVVAVLSLGACGAQDETSDNSAKESTPQQSAETKKPKKAREYTDNDVQSTIDKCSKLNKPGGDMIDTIINTPGVLDYTSIGGIMSEGVESDVFQCIVEELDLPHRVVKEINTETDPEQSDSVGNLNIKWSHTDDGQISVYIAAHSLDQ